MRALVRFRNLDSVFAMSGLIVVIFSLYSHSTFAFKCQGLFETSSYYEVHYPIKSKEYLELQDHLSDHLNKNAEARRFSAHISQSRRYWFRSVSHMLRDGVNKSSLTKVSVFGYPYVEKGVSYIDFNMKDFTLNRVLKRMPLEDYLKNLITDSSVYKENSFVLIGKSKKKGFTEKYEPGRVIKRGINKVLIRTTSGQHYFSIKDLNRWNSFFSEKDSQYLSDFFEKGGKADILVYSEKSQTRLSGLFLVVKEFPVGFKGFSDTRTVVLLNQFIHENGVVLYSTSEINIDGGIYQIPSGKKKEGLIGYISNKVQNSNLKNQVFIATEGTTADAVVHERVHWKDNLDIIYPYKIVENKIINSSLLNVHAKRKILHKNLLDDFLRYVKELRAYAVQLEYLKNSSDPNDINRVLETQNRVVVLFHRYYKPPVIELLLILKEESKELYEELDKFYLKYGFDAAVFLGQ